MRFGSPSHWVQAMMSANITYSTGIHDSSITDLASQVGGGGGEGGERKEERGGGEGEGEGRGGERQESNPVVRWRTRLEKY